MSDAIDAVDQACQSLWRWVRNRADVEALRRFVQSFSVQQLECDQTLRAVCKIACVALCLPNPTNASSGLRQLIALANVELWPERLSQDNRDPWRERSCLVCGTLNGVVFRYEGSARPNNERGYYVTQDEDVFEAPPRNRHAIFRTTPWKMMQGSVAPESKIPNAVAQALRTELQRPGHQLYIYLACLIDLRQLTSETVYVTESGPALRWVPALIHPSEMLRWYGAEVYYDPTYDTTDNVLPLNPDCDLLMRWTGPPVRSDCAAIDGLKPAQVIKLPTNVTRNESIWLEGAECTTPTLYQRRVLREMIAGYKPSIPLADKPYYCRDSDSYHVLNDLSVEQLRRMPTKYLEAMYCCPKRGMPEKAQSLRGRNLRQYLLRRSQHLRCPYPVCTAEQVGRPSALPGVQVQIELDVREAVELGDQGLLLSLAIAQPVEHSVSYWSSNTAEAVAELNALLQHMAHTVYITLPKLAMRAVETNDLQCLRQMYQPDAAKRAIVCVQAALNLLNSTNFQAACDQLEPGDAHETNAVYDEVMRDLDELIE